LVFDWFEAANQLVVVHVKMLTVNVQCFVWEVVHLRLPVNMCKPLLLWAEQALLVLMANNRPIKQSISLDLQISANHNLLGVVRVGRFDDDSLTTANSFKLFQLLIKFITGFLLIRKMILEGAGHLISLASISLTF